MQLTNFFKNNRIRSLIILFIGLLIIGIVIAVTQSGDSTANNLTTTTSKIPQTAKSTPGAKVSKKYRELQEKANIRGSEQAKASGDTFIPTLLGNADGYDDLEFERQFEAAFDDLGGECSDKTAKALELQGFSQTQIIMQLKRVGCAPEQISSIFDATAIAKALVQNNECATKNQDCSKLAVEQLKAAGREPAQIAQTLKERGCSAADIAKAMHEAGYSASEIANALKIAGFDINEIAKALKATGFSAAEIAKALRDANFSATEIAGALQNAGFDAETITKALLSAGIDPATVARALKSLGLNAEQIARLLRAANVPDDVIMAALSATGFAAEDISKAMQAQKNCSTEKVTELKNAGASPDKIATYLKDMGCSAKDIIQAMLAAGFSPEQIVQALKNAGFSAADIAKAMKDTGFSASEIAKALKNAGFSASDIAKAMKDAGFSVQEIAKAMKNAGFSAADIAKSLKNAGFTDDVITNALKNAGFSLNEIKDALRSAGIDEKALDRLLESLKSCSSEKVIELKANGYSATGIAQYLKKMGCNADDIVKAMLSAGFSAADIAQAMKDAGFSAVDIANALKEAGLSASEIANALKKAGFSASEIANALKKAGFRANDIAQALRLAGFDPDEIAKALRVAGFSAADIASALKNAGFSADEIAQALKLAGFNEQDIIKALAQSGFSEDEITSALQKSRANRSTGSSNNYGCNAITASTMQQKGATIEEIITSMQKNGCSLSEIAIALRYLGYTTNEIAEGMQAAGASKVAILDALDKANFNPLEIAKALSNLDNTSVDYATVPTASPADTPIQPAISGAARDALVGEISAAMQAKLAQAQAIWGVVPQSQVVVGSWNPEQQNKGPSSTTNGNKNYLDEENNTSDQQILKAGTIMFGVLETHVNSDEKAGPILAKLVSGPLKGSKLIGSMNVNIEAENISLYFNTISIPDKRNSTSISLVAIDPETARTALASDVDHHYLLRWGSVLAASFVDGYASTIASSGTTTTTVDGQAGKTTTVSSPIASAKQNLFKGIANVASSFSEIISKFSDLPVTISIESGTSLALLLTSDFALSAEVPPVTQKSDANAAGVSLSTEQATSLINALIQKQNQPQTLANNLQTDNSAGGNTDGAAR